MRIRSILISVLLVFFFSDSVVAQCNHTFLSTDGYTVNVVLTPVMIIPSTTSCDFGYNYNVSIDYDITFNPATTPPLNDLQGTMDCGPQTGSSFDLPEEGGTGNTVTGGNPYTSDMDCATATVASRMCDNINIIIQGSGLGNQTFSCAVVLPVSMSYFDVLDRSGSAFLVWETEQEVNNDYFTVERSIDAKNWEPIGRIAGAGTSAVKNSYEFQDRSTPSGTLYYRIKQTDFDGKFTYSLIRSIEIDRQTLSISPIPASDQITVSGSSNNLKIISTAGTLIKEVKADIEQVDISALESGVYYLISGDLVTRFVKI